MVLPQAAVVVSHFTASSSGSFTFNEFNGPFQPELSERRVPFRHVTIMDLHSHTFKIQLMSCHTFVLITRFHIIKHGSWILPFYFLPFHSNLFASCNLCLFKECWKVSALKTMRSNTKACQYKSITQCNLSQQDLVLECLEGLRFFYTAGSSSGQGPGRGWHCLYARLLIWHHEAADYCSSTEVPKML